MKTFTERFNKAFTESGLTLSELCRLTNIPKSAMSQYKSGAFAPKSNRVYELAKAFNVSEAWLMGYDVPKERKIIEGTNSDKVNRQELKFALFNTDKVTDEIVDEVLGFADYIKTREGIK